MTKMLKQFLTICISAGLLIHSTACSNAPDETPQPPIQELIAQNRLDEAQERLRSALIQNPRNADLHYNMSVVQRLQGNLVKARSSASKAFSYAPNDPEVKLLMVEYALEFGETDEALDLYHSLPSEIRVTPRALSIHGILLSQQRKWQQASIAFQNAIDQGSQDPATYAALANSLIQQGEVDQAKTYLQKAESLNPNESDSIRQIAECYLALTDAKKARDLAMPIANDRPNDARIWSLIGRTEMILLRFRESESAFTRALAAPNATPWHKVDYAMMLFAAQRESEALKQAASAESRLAADSIRIHNPALFNLLATLYARDSQWLMANKYLTQSIQVNPNQPKVRELLAKVQTHFNAATGDNGSSN